MAAAWCWTASSGQNLLFDRDALGANVSGVALSPAGNRLAVPLPHGSAKVRYLSTAAGTINFYGHTGEITDLEFTPDGKLLATASQDGTARIWDSITGEEQAILAGHRQQINRLAFFPDGLRLATTSEDGTTRVWDISSGSSHEWLTISDPSNPVESASFSHDGRSIAVKGVFRASVYDAASGERTAVLDIGKTPDSIPELSPVSGLVASTYEENSPALHDAKTGKVIRVFKGHTKRVGTLAFSPDGGWLVSGDFGGVIKIWNAASGKELDSLEVHTGKINDLEVSPDGSLLASSSEDGRVILWDLATRQPALTLIKTNRRSQACPSARMAIVWLLPERMATPGSGIRAEGSCC